MDPANHAAARLQIPAGADRAAEIANLTVRAARRPAALAALSGRLSCDELARTQLSISFYSLVHCKMSPGS
jgi:hypothetical protein